MQNGNIIENELPPLLLLMMIIMMIMMMMMMMMILMLLIVFGLQNIGITLKNTKTSTLLKVDTTMVVSCTIIARPSLGTGRKQSHQNHLTKT